MCPCSAVESMMERAGREMGRQTLVDVQLDRLQDSMTGLQKNLQIATEYVKRVVVSSDFIQFLLTMLGLSCVRVRNIHQL